MKRIIFSLVLALILMGVAIPVMAVELSDYKYVIVNTSATTKATAISTDIIVPTACRLLQVTVTAARAGSTEVVVGVYDCASVGATLNSALEGEVESASAGSTAALQYLRPLKIFNGVTILQGAFTTVLVEWERISP